MKTKEQIPVLLGWSSLPRAGVLLRVSRQRIFQMALEEWKFASIHMIPGSGVRPAAYVVQNIEVARMRRLQCEECRQAADAAGASPSVLLYCEHTGLDIPQGQTAALMADLERQEAEAREAEPAPAAEA